MAKSTKKTSAKATGAPGMSTAMMGSSPAAARAWLEIMNESARFVTDRLQEDVATQQALLKCKTPAEVMQVQSAFFQKALEQYPDEAQRMFEIMSGAAQETLKDAKTGTARGYDDIPV